MDSIETLARKWLEQDKDEQTRSEIEALLEEKNTAELESRLRHRIAFGTAGLRSSMKAGFAHMNSLTVLQASHGLADYIIEQLSQDGKSNPSIVIGHDARHNSEKFARLAAAAFLEKNFHIYWLERLAHTPLVPYAIKHFNASAGIMITASHNPKTDNGYKVYWSNGSQIIPPHDAGIARAISQVSNITSWSQTSVDTPPSPSLVTPIFSPTAKSYLESIRELVWPLPSAEQSLPFTYTPLHGVGLTFMRQVAHMLWIRGDTMRVVDEQAEPDPEFPTTPFPNPEEVGALDLAVERARRDGVELVLANDPDGDRFSAAVPAAAAPGSISREFVQLSGNQLGVLFAAHLWETCEGKTEKGRIVMLASTVSSRMLASMAEKEGFRFRETLTGFKWLGNVAQKLREEEGLEPIFAFEEAIGYMFPSVVWDKDGIAAAAVFLTAAMRWRKQGLTPWQKLQELYQKYGYFEDANTYVVSPSPETTKRVFEDIRKLNAGSRPKELGGKEILRWRDLTIGFDSGTADNKPVLPVDPNAQMITCELQGDVVFTVRGSGTEPKIKFYIEARAHSSEEAKTRAKGVLYDLLREWFKPEYGLKLAGSG